MLHGDIDASVAAPQQECVDFGDSKKELEVPHKPSPGAPCLFKASPALALCVVFVESVESAAINLVHVILL